MKAYLAEKKRKREGEQQSASKGKEEESMGWAVVISPLKGTNGCDQPSLEGEKNPRPFLCAGGEGTKPVTGEQALGRKEIPAY